MKYPFGIFDEMLNHKKGKFYQLQFHLIVFNKFQKKEKRIYPAQVQMKKKDQKVPKASDQGMTKISVKGRVGNRKVF